MRCMSVHNDLTCGSTFGVRLVGTVGVMFGIQHNSTTKLKIKTPSDCILALTILSPFLCCFFLYLNVHISNTVLRIRWYGHTWNMWPRQEVISYPEVASHLYTRFSFWSIFITMRSTDNSAHLNQKLERVLLLLLRSAHTPRQRGDMSHWPEVFTISRQLVVLHTHIFVFLFDNLHS